MEEWSNTLYVQLYGADKQKNSEIACFYAKHINFANIFSVISIGVSLKLKDSLIALIDAIVYRITPENSSEIENLDWAENITMILTGNFSTEIVIVLMINLISSTNPNFRLDFC